MLLILSAVLLIVGLVIVIAQYRQRPSRKTEVAAVALALALAAIGGVWAYGVYESNVLQNTWDFGYTITIQGNETAPESLVVPIVRDQGLLSGIHLSSGTANWSYVDTPKGRGLFVRFTGSATIEASVSAFPRPAVLPDTSPTMTVTNNCTAQPSNCTGPPWLWIFSSGPAGAYVGASIGSVYFAGYLATGWASYRTWPPAVPTV